MSLLAVTIWFTTWGKVGVGFTFHDWEHGSVVGLVAPVRDDLEFSRLIDEEEGSRPLLPRGFRPRGWHSALYGVFLQFCGLAAYLEDSLMRVVIKRGSGLSFLSCGATWRNIAVFGFPSGKQKEKGLAWGESFGWDLHSQRRSGTGTLAFQLECHVALQLQFLWFSKSEKTEAGGESFRVDFALFGVGFGWVTSGYVLYEMYHVLLHILPKFLPRLSCFTCSSLLWLFITILT